MTTAEGVLEAPTDSELGEASGSFQRLLAMLVDAKEVRVGGDPLLAQGEDDKTDELELRLYSV